VFLNYYSDAFSNFCLSPKLQCATKTALYLQGVASTSVPLCAQHCVSLHIHCNPNCNMLPKLHCTYRVSHQPLFHCAHSTVYLCTHTVTLTTICYQTVTKLPAVLELLQADRCSLNSFRQHRNRRS
jgi:hypothetical protein